MDQILSVSKDPETRKASPLSWVTVRVCFATGLLWTAFMSIVVRLGYLWSPKRGYAARRAWGKGCCSLMGIHLRVSGIEHLPKGEAMVLAPNHASLYDILVMCALPLDFSFIAKRPISRIPLLGKTLSVMGTYWVERTGTGKDIRVMQKVEEGLRQGVPVLIFPEGTRSRTGELLPMKKGAFRTALNAGVPLLPIGISGTFAVAPPNRIPLYRGHDVIVRIGEPVRPDPGVAVEALMESFRGTLAGLLELNSRRNML